MEDTDQTVIEAPATLAETPPEEQALNLAPEPAVSQAPPPSPAAADRLTELIDRLGGHVEELRASLRTAADTAQRLANEESARLDQIRVRDALLEKVEASKPSFQFQALRPMAQGVAGVIDLMQNLQRQPPADSDGFARGLKLVEQKLRELLAVHGIDALAPAAGAAFDRRFHHVIETQPTAERDRHEQVASTLQEGFVFYGVQERTAAIVPTLIRPAKVVTWKYNPELEAAKGPPQDS